MAAVRRRSTSLPASQRGSVLLTTLVFATMLAMLAYSVYELTNNNYTLAMRNQLQAEARAVAESELEYLLFQFKSTVVAGNSAADAPAILATSNSPAGVAVADNAAYPDTDTTRSPFLTAHQAAGWRVRRSIVLDRFLTNQRVPGTTKIGDFTYLIARVEVLPPVSNPFAVSTASVRVGRRLINSNTTIFQYSIFFQGTLELNPGTDTTINGDVVANGSIYMGPRSGFNLTLNGKVRYLGDHYFNTDSGGNTTYTNPDAPTPPVTLVAPTWGTSQAAQLETMDSAENLLGGIDVSAESQTRPDLFGPSGRTDPSLWTAAEQAAAENNVYRSLIVPPPNAAGTSEYPNSTSSTTDDAVISVRRAYTRASLILTVNTDGTVSFVRIQDGTTRDVTSYLTGALTDYTDYVSNPSASASYRTNVYDERENKAVTTTEIDIADLKTGLDTLAALPTTNPDHWSTFNGLIYINLKSSSGTTPAAIRLTNGATLPATKDTGFSVATNGGIYVKGNYNTGTVTDDDGTTRNPAAMLIGDAVTVLSDAWTDSTTSRPLSARVAGNSMTLNAGLLTGNIASTSSASSGGAQNLVRYLENWTGKSVTFNGSIGRLFSSTQFTAAFPGAGVVYLQPNRIFSFDSNMLSHRPPGSPESTAFSRGSFFTWSYNN